MIFLHRFQSNIGLWCNGNITDSGPVVSGSNPDSPTKAVANYAAAFVFSPRIPQTAANSNQICPCICLFHIFAYRCKPLHTTIHGRETGNHTTAESNVADTCRSS